MKEFPENNYRVNCCESQDPRIYRFDELVLPSVQGSIKLEGEIFKNELAYHENDNKTNNEKFFCKYT